MTEEEVQLALSKIQDPGEVSYSSQKVDVDKCGGLTFHWHVFVSPAGWGVGELGVKGLCSTNCPAFKASSQPRNHAYRVLTLCPHHVMTVVRGFSGPQWLSCWVSNRKTMAIRIRLLPQLCGCSRRRGWRLRSCWGSILNGLQLFGCYSWRTGVPVCGGVHCNGAEAALLFFFFSLCHLIIKWVKQTGCMMAKTSDAARHFS